MRHILEIHLLIPIPIIPWTLHLLQVLQIPLKHFEQFLHFFFPQLRPRWRVLTCPLVHFAYDRVRKIRYCSPRWWTLWRFGWASGGCWISGTRRCAWRWRWRIIRRRWWVCSRPSARSSVYGENKKNRTSCGRTSTSPSPKLYARTRPNGFWC